MGPIPFRYELASLKVDGFKEFVEDWWWETNLLGWKRYCLLQKLKYVKGKLKLWVQTRRKADKVEEHDWWDDMQNLYQLEEVGSLSQEHHLRRKEIKVCLKKKALMDEIKWKQCSRIRWPKERDKNTKFFHQIARARRKKIYIHSLQVHGEGLKLA